MTLPFSEPPFQPPLHFRDEVRELGRRGLDRWSAVAGLSDQDLRQLARSGRASEQRLRRLRGQALLMHALEVTAAEASLLLHAGIPDAAALSTVDPDWLLRQLGRFQRQLLGRDATPISAVVVRRWIARARSHG
ncbi:MAG: DUF4332 domain-containing protein [Cyanobium sp.]